MSFVNCLSPRFITNPYTHEKMCVPCGHCEACRASRQSKWVTRINLEARFWKHVIFFTLTYDDVHLPVYDLSQLTVEDETLIEAVEKSIDFCKARDYQINYPCVEDIQKFIKRLRKWLSYYEPEKEKQVLRYYVASEYGPTTARVHYHGLLFTSSDKFYEKFAQRICKAWSDYDNHTRSWIPIGRIDAQTVSGDAANYVAGYVTFNSLLPPILRHKIFRPFALYSKMPPLGFNEFTEAQVQKIVHDGLTEISYNRPSDNRIVSVPLPRTFKDRLFPKCKGFNKLDTYGRVTLYRLALDFQFESPKVVYSHLSFIKNWYRYSYQVDLLESLFGELPDFENDLSSNEPFDYDSFVRLYRISCRVCTLCAQFNYSISDYVKKIENFYSLSDYNNLVKQLQAEQEFMSVLPKNDIRYLPYLIDPLFGDNSRGLTLSALAEYRKQFCLSDIDNMDIRITPEFRKFSTRVIDFVNNNHKTRAKNEYVQNNPNIKKLLFL